MESLITSNSNALSNKRQLLVLGVAAYRITMPVIIGQQCDICSDLMTLKDRNGNTKSNACQHCFYMYVH